MSQNKMDSKKPSLRQSENYDREDDELAMLPELQTQLAEELSSILDSQLRETYKMRSNESPSPSDTEDLDFKLFTTSDPTKCTKVNDLPRRRPVAESSSDSDAEYERLAAVAVSGAQVLAGSRLGHADIKCEHSDRGEPVKHKEDSVSADDADAALIKKRHKHEERTTRPNGTETKRTKKHKKRKKQKCSDTSTDAIDQDV